jgi:Zn-finger protein
MALDGWVDLEDGERVWNCEWCGMARRREELHLWVDRLVGCGGRMKRG